MVKITTQEINAIIEEMLQDFYATVGNDTLRALYESDIENLSLRSDVDLNNKAVVDRYNTLLSEASTADDFAAVATYYTTNQTVLEPLMIDATYINQMVNTIKALKDFVLNGLVKYVKDTGVSYQGTWDATKQYSVNDYVLYDNILYCAIADNQNSDPSLAGSTNWGSLFDFEACVKESFNTLQQTCWYGTCNETTVKQNFYDGVNMQDITYRVQCSGFALTDKARIAVVFQSFGGSSGSPTHGRYLSINGSAGIPIFLRGAAIDGDFNPLSKSTICFVYADGRWNVEGTYADTARSALTAAEANNALKLGNNLPGYYSPSSHNHDSSYAGKTHAHGNISNDGGIGSAANLPVFTGSGGVLTTSSAANARSLLGAAPAGYGVGDWLWSNMVTNPLDTELKTGVYGLFQGTAGTTNLPPRDSSGQFIGFVEVYKFNANWQFVIATNIPNGERFYNQCFKNDSNTSWTGWIPTHPKQQQVTRIVAANSQYTELFDDNFQYIIADVESPSGQSRIVMPNEASKIVLDLGSPCFATVAADPEGGKAILSNNTPDSVTFNLVAFYA